LLSELDNASHIYITSNHENCEAYQNFLAGYSSKYSAKKTSLLVINGTFDDVLFTLNDSVKPAEPICICCCDNIAPIKSHFSSFEEDIISDKYDQIIVTPKIENWQKYGILTVSDDKSHVTSFRHNDLITEREKAVNDKHYIDGGIAITRHDFIEKIRKEGSFEKFMEKSLASKRVGYFEPDIWFDIGNEEDYNKTCESVLFPQYFDRCKTDE